MIPARAYYCTICSCPSVTLNKGLTGNLLRGVFSAVLFLPPFPFPLFFCLRVAPQIQLSYLGCSSRPPSDRERHLQPPDTFLALYIQQKSVCSRSAFGRRCFNIENTPLFAVWCSTLLKFSHYCNTAIFRKMSVQPRVEIVVGSRGFSSTASTAQKKQNGATAMNYRGYAAVGGAHGTSPQSDANFMYRLRHDQWTDYVRYFRQVDADV